MNTDDFHEHLIGKGRGTSPCAAFALWLQIWGARPEEGVTQSNTAVSQLRRAQKSDPPEGFGIHSSLPSCGGGNSRLRADVPSQPGFLVPKVLVAAEGHREPSRGVRAQGSAQLGISGAGRDGAREKGSSP